VNFTITQKRSEQLAQEIEDRVAYPFQATPAEMMVAMACWMAAAYRQAMELERMKNS
jgi:hypothetical protein